MTKQRVALNDATKRRLLFPRRGVGGLPTRAPDGYGSIQPAGYRVISVNGCVRLEHRLVWEMNHGPVPDGYQIHHKNGVPLDNNIGNLELVDPKTHRRIHAGWRVVDGEWIKPCSGCGGVFPLSAFYALKKGPRPRCKQCHRAATMAWTRSRRAGK